MPLFDTHIIVDWSARSKPSPKAPSKDAIFWAVAREGVVASVSYARTRSEALTRLRETLLQERAARRRVLVGFDFPFGYPRGVAQRLTGKASALALWDWLGARIEDGPDNANNRYDVAEEINRHFPGLGPMWGRPAGWDHPDVPVTAKARHGDHPPERRFVDTMAKGAKTVWQLAYAGSVGSQILVGLPGLKALRDGIGAQVWPFDTGLTVPDANIVMAEIYPSLLQAEAHAARANKEPLDAAQVRVNAQAFARLDRAGRLAPLFAPELSLAGREVIETEEAMILGVGFETDLKAALPAMARPAPDHGKGHIHAAV